MKTQSVNHFETYLWRGNDLDDDESKNHPKENVARTCGKPEVHGVVGKVRSSSILRLYEGRQRVGGQTRERARLRGQGSIWALVHELSVTGSRRVWGSLTVQHNTTLKRRAERPFRDIITPLALHCAIPDCLRHLQPLRELVVGPTRRGLHTTDNGSSTRVTKQTSRF